MYCPTQPHSTAPATPPISAPLPVLPFLLPMRPPTAAPVAPPFAAPFWVLFIEPSLAQPSSKTLTIVTAATERSHTNRLIIFIGIPTTLYLERISARSLIDLIIQN